MRRMAHFDEANVEIATFPSLVVNRFVCLSDLIVMNTRDTKIMTNKRVLKICQRIFVMRANLNSGHSLETLDLHLLLSNEKARGSR